MERFIIYFVIGAFVGYILELFFKTISRESIKNAGMGKGPFCMSYGIGLAIVVTMLKYETNIFYLFVLSSLICTAVEYISGVFLEKVFGKIMWDYNKLKFGIGQHISIEFMLIWGVFGTLFLKYVMPKMDLFINSFTKVTIYFYYAIAFFILVDYGVQGAMVRYNLMKQENKKEDKNG